MQLNKPEKAVQYYIDAADKNSNEFTSPSFLLKAGWTYEILGNWDKALSMYEKLKKDYPRAREARDIDKYIARAKAHLKEI